MYAPVHYVQHDKEALLALVRAKPFAHLLVNGADGPLAAHAPLIVELGENGALELIGHVARANPFWREAEKAERALAVFNGPNAYVSPNLYPSKLENSRVVPTWNYIAIEARGVIEVDAEPANMRVFLERLTEQMEEGAKRPWRLADAPDDYVRNLSNGIVGLRMRVDALKGKWKLSQKAPACDFAAVRDAFAASEFQNERDIAAAMAAIAHEEEA